VYIEPDAIRAQAVIHGLMLSDEDVTAIRDILRRTKEALSKVQSVTAPWDDAPAGFLPPGFLSDV